MLVTPSIFSYVTQVPRPVIWGTAWGTDVDDVVAASTLIWAERCGIIDIISVGMNVRMVDSVVLLDALFDSEGRPEITIGIDHAVTDFGGSSPY